MNDRRFLRRWVIATWFGWLLGIPLVIASALLGEAVGIGGSQVLVGVGMGTGIGFVQARALRDLVPRAAWIGSCIVGLSTPFLLSDVSSAAGLDLAYSLRICVAIGGLLVGTSQALLLRTRLRGTWTWIVASAVGWTLAAARSSAADALFRSRTVTGAPGARAYLGILALGGLVLGLATGASLAWMPRRDPAA
jgi:hypothetical protein